MDHSFLCRVPGIYFLVQIVSTYCVQGSGCRVVQIWYKNPGAEFLVRSAIAELVKSPGFRVGSDLVQNSWGKTLLQSLCRVPGWWCRERHSASVAVPSLTVRMLQWGISL